MSNRLKRRRDENLAQGYALLVPIGFTVAMLMFGIGDPAPP